MSAHKLLARLVHLHPALWEIAWNTTARATFLLPHDRSYLALRHFIALQPGGLFLDIGANNGVSVRSFRKLDPKARVVSLEPNPLLEPWLSELTQTDDLFSYRMVAAGDQAGRLTLYVPQYGRVSLHPLAAIDQKQAIEGVRTSFGTRIARGTTIATHEVNVIPIDDLDLAPAIIKVDAEGAESSVLIGASHTINRCRPFLMLEMCWNDRAEINAFLKNHDYALLAYDEAADRFSPNGLQPATQWAQRNFFGVPNEKRGLLNGVMQAG